MNLKLFRDKNFFLLMQGEFVSQMGSLMQNFALSLYVLNAYDSTTLFASILIVAAIPRLLLGPFAGVLVDWFDRKKIIVRLDILSGCLVLALGALYYVDYTLPLWSIYLISVLLSLIGTMFGPAVSTVIPSIIDEENLLDANSVNHVIMTISSLISPVVAAAVLSMTSIGVILVVNGISFLMSAISESFIDIPKEHKKPETIDFKTFKDDFVEGISTIKSSRFMTTLMILALGINFLLSPVFSVGFPYVLKKVIQVTDFEFGLVQAVFGLSMLIGGLAASLAGKKLSVGTILKIDIGMQGPVVGIYAFITSSLFLGMFSTYYPPLILFLILTLIFGCVIAVGNISIGTIMQKIIPKDKMGRVFTVFGTVATGAVPLGQGLYGLMNDSMGHTKPMVIFAVALLFVGTYSAVAISKASDELETKEEVVA